MPTPNAPQVSSDLSKTGPVTENGNEVSRRTFLSRLSMAGTVGIAAHGVRRSLAKGQPGPRDGIPTPSPSNANPNMPWASRSGCPAWQPPPALADPPNILIILVDQFRQPMWLNSSQASFLQATVVPNIFQRIRNKSYVFQSYFASANRCTPCRATLMTGLYAPQTHMYVGEDNATTPNLQPAFPTWGWAIQQSDLFGGTASPYADNVWWSGKWHLSDDGSIGGAQPLLPYGFQTKSIPGVDSKGYECPSPNGFPNEGTNGGIFSGKHYASDADIAADFTDNFLPSASGPWCATVSFINPHDIALGPNWMNPNLNSVMPLADCKNNQWTDPWFYPPNPDSPLQVFTNSNPFPNPWNFEKPNSACWSPSQPKPTLQYAFFNACNCSYGEISSASAVTLFLNNYYWLQNLVDFQVGKVLTALANSSFANNTIIVFASDHGEHLLSHGLHDKGCAVYDEGIRAPLYVQFPGQTASYTMEQMCSSVDFFGLICDLAAASANANHAGSWRTCFPSLAARESIYSYLVSNSSEQWRLVQPAWGNVGSLAGQPYIMHTYDETKPNEDGSSIYCGPVKDHIVCLRTKSQSTCGQSSGFMGGKLAFYANWSNCTLAPDGNSGDYEWEFYDYQAGGPQNQGNTAEIGNDYFSTDSTVAAHLASFQAALGTSFAGGPCALTEELNAPLQGAGTDGNPLTHAQCVAQNTYLNYSYGDGCQQCSG
jgi:arylsulfatase A-like enzyme